LSNKSVNFALILPNIIMRADGRRGGEGVGFSPPIVCRFSVRYLETMQHQQSSRVQVFHEESWKPVYFEGQNVKIWCRQPQNRCWRGSLHSCERWLIL